MYRIDDLPALRAAAGDVRAARNLRRVAELCETSPARAAGEARRLAHMERVLTSHGAGATPIVDWLSAWAMAHMALHSAVGRVEIDGPPTMSLRERTPAILQLLDAALLAAVAGRPPSSVTASIGLRRTGACVAIRMDCSPAARWGRAAAAVVEMATVAGLPAAWRIDGERASIQVLVDLGDASGPEGEAR